MPSSPGEIKVVPVCLCSCCCFLSIFAVIALPLSFKSLDQGKYALFLSWHTQEIGDTYTDPGMYAVGLGNMLVEFPSTLQTMYFVSDRRGLQSSEEDAEHPAITRGPMRARSSDGLEMTVALSLQWRLRPNALHPLYKILGGGSLEYSLYRDEFVRFARAAIVESCANFAADYFFVNRENITRDMTEKVTAAFDRPELGLQAEIQGLQLREVDLPDEYDAEIVRTQEQMQEIEVALAERKEQRVVMEKELMVAQTRVNQLLEESEGAAQKTRIMNEAYVNQLLFYQEKQALANAAILSKFWNSTDPWARLFEMMEIHGLAEHSDKKLLINL